MRKQAERFIWQNARLLDRHLFAHLFAGGAREPVLAALKAYQNPDGGFGNALEPDIRCPQSQPVPTEMALKILDYAGWDDAVARRACDWLETITTPEGGVPYVLPSVMDYPRAPWWNPEEGLPATVNPTAGIAGMLHKHGVQHPWLERATAFCWQAIESGRDGEVHALMAVTHFLEHVPDRERAQRAFQPLAERIFAENLVALDPGAAGYVKKPLDWAPTPDSICRPLFAGDVIAAHLQALADRQQAHGGWDISWPAISPACHMEWRGWLTVEALRTLTAYGKGQAV
ncbi:MAG TPA: hypothetical protein VNT75_16560 [Symbiobacteriaceae bacterium]|nr:hypothetical protein [Symbiobacteriaceae bacterium]